MSDFFKRVFLSVFLSSTLITYSQDTDGTPDENYSYEPDYNTWAIGGGFSILNLHGDLRSFDTYSGDAYWNFGGYLYADKMFNPILGVELKANVSQLGGEMQKLYDSGGISESTYYRILYAELYSSDVLMIEGVSFGFETNLVLNLDNLWRRHSKKWSFTSYFGAGYQKYNSKLLIKDYVYDPILGEDNTSKYYKGRVDESGVILDADFSENSNRDFSGGAGSLYLNMALGTKYRLNDKFDIEARGVINVNNEDHLDAAISKKQTYESFFTGSLGVVYKFGKKEKYAIWVQDEEDAHFQIVDSDNDGVQDELDEEPNRMPNAEVYGNGVAIDSDKDGLKDYEDSCPLEPGPRSNNGCPLVEEVVYNEPEEVVVAPVVAFNEDEKNDIQEKINLLSKSIYFETASDVLREVSYKPLNDITGIMLEYPDSRFNIEGHTDSRGNDNYNLDLSNKRSKRVYNFLTNKGISSDRLSSKGFGEVNPIATNDTPEGRQQNRRVEINFIDPDSEEGKRVYPQGTVLKRSNSYSRRVDYSGGAAVDSDGDGVPDVYDNEPNTPKESRVYGDGVSVDSDMDGVPDYIDDCPFAKGTAESGGCPLNGQNTNVVPMTRTTNEPDADGDGVPDSIDVEADTPPGVNVYSNGVAFDTDKDGVPDHEDKCPRTNGNVENGGCPENDDADGDGVIDSLDDCPDEVGSSSNFGCPIKKATGDIETELKLLISKMKFARSEGHVLKSNNIQILEKVAVLLNDYMAISVRIEVHTNNKPNLQYNLDLSKRRAFAIKKYLTQVGGISSSRLDIVGLGGTKPKYDFEDKAQNSKNNRVELYMN